MIVYKNILAVFIGTVIMVLVDFMTSRWAHLDLSVGIPVSVLAGSIVASFMAINNRCLFGFLIGVVNSCITVAIFYLISAGVQLQEEGYAMADVVMRPMMLSLVFGVIGGAIGNVIKRKSSRGTC
jgi:lipoprotein signal peptidase